MNQEKIQQLATFYYSRKDVQDAIFSFCRNRETVPRYYEGFGKRPDSIQYPRDIFSLVQKGATSLHCSEELWSEPLSISTELSKEKLDEMRIGWDLLIDIDCKWFDYTRLAAKAIITALKEHGIKNVGVKFSGSKGMHIIVPWKAFPEEVREGGENKRVSEMFPEYPRIIASYLRYYSEKIFQKIAPEDIHKQFESVNIRRGIKCEKCREIAEEYQVIDFKCSNCIRKETKKFIKGKEVAEYRCPDCKGKMLLVDKKTFYECRKCRINSKDNPQSFSAYEELDLFQLMGLDIVLVSPRHLFRAPYSLHEKTGFVSVVLSESELDTFQPKEANPLKVKIKNFYPEAKKDEAKNLLVSALEWRGEEKRDLESREEKSETAKTGKKVHDIQVDKSSIVYPPAIKKILEGMEDGKKRALFILLNFFRSLGFSKEEVKSKIDEWNKKNPKKLKDAYIQSQLEWTFNQKKMLPPNYDKPFYKDIGLSPDEEELRSKNPVSYVIRKSKWMKEK
jgi:DNA primase catalytic subunit